MANIIDRAKNWFEGFWQKPDPGLLKAEISAADTAYGRSIESSHPSAGLTPETLAQILSSSSTGNAERLLDLAEDMEERDPHYLSIMGTRKRQVSQLPITIEASSDSRQDQHVADFIREWTTRDVIESELFDILDAVGKGYSGSELVWNQDGKLWYPEFVKWRHPRWFTFDQQTGEIPMLLGGYEGGGERDLCGAPLPPAKFLFHVHPAKSGLPIRGGLGRALAWTYLFKNYVIKDWSGFVELYGRPLRIGKYPAGSTEKQIETLMEAIEGIGHDFAAVIPQSMLVEIVEAKAAASAAVYREFAEYMDQQESKAVLGQTATTDSVTGGLGSGKEHGEVRGDIERADAKVSGSSIRRDVVTAMVRLNYGEGVPVPKVRIGREEDWDPDKMMPAIKTFVAMGGRVEESVVRDRLGLPDPPEGPEVKLLGKPAAEPEAENLPVKGRRPQSAAERPVEASTRFLGASYRSYSRVPGRGALAEVVAAAVADRVAEKMGAAGDIDVDQQIASYLTEDWEEILSPMVDPVVAAMQAAGSYEEAVAALTAGLDAMDTARLEDAVARGSLVARAAEGGVL
jgi:phage gp29-like protein